MKNKVLILSKISALLIIVLAFTYTSLSAATYTAVASGNWNSTATWGGTAPGYAVTIDQITIPAGFTVNLVQNVNISGGSASLVLNGTISSTSSTDTLVIGTGTTLSGTGAFNVNALMLNTGAVMLFTGTVSANTFTTAVASLSTSANITVYKTLTMSAGALSIITAGSLTMGAGSTVMISGGTLSQTGTGALTLTNPYSVVYTVATTSGLELSGSGLGNVTVNIGSTNMLTLGSDLYVHDTLSLISGTLLLNGYNLIINGNLNAIGAGVVSSTAVSNITVNSNNTISGALRFDAVNNTVKTLTIAFGGNKSNAITLGSSVVVADSLRLIRGLINTNNYSITLSALAGIAGGGDTSYVITSVTGYLSIPALAGAANRMYPIGTSSMYAPARIALNTASASGNVQVGVDNNVYEQGTTGINLAIARPVVNATWYLNSDITTGLSLNLTTIWDTTAEVNKFDRTHSYISHFTNGSWDAQVVAAAGIENSSMYNLQRNNITSLSPFAVFDRNSAPNAVTNISTAASFDIYPNPASDYITIKGLTANASPVRIDISDVTGRVLISYMLQDNTNPNVSLTSLSKGNYFIHLYSSDVNVVKQISIQ